MTLDTRVYLQDPVDYREVFAKCNQLLGANEGVLFKDDATDVMNLPNQGLSAWLIVYHGSDGPYRGEPEGCDEYCDFDCDGQHRPACWVEVSLDTAYGYSGPEGGCGDLHARLVAELGRWLDGKGVRWSWKNEFTGEVFRGYEGLTELGGGGAKAATWFREIVAPALKALGAS